MAAEMAILQPAHAITLRRAGSCLPGGQGGPGGDLRRDEAGGQPGRYRGAERHCGAASCRAWLRVVKYAVDRRSHSSTMTARPTAHSATLMTHVDGVRSPWVWVLSTVRLSMTNRIVDRIRTPGRPRLVRRA